MSFWNGPFPSEVSLTRSFHEGLDTSPEDVGMPAKKETEEPQREDSFLDL